MFLDYLPAIIAFVFGTIVGSFLNVIIFRLNTGFGFGGRSMCLSCGKTLEWIELIPVVSYFLQGGKCRKCLSTLSWQYPLIELATGALFVLMFWRFPPVDDAMLISTLLYLFATCLLMVIVVYDMRHKIIPDSIVYTFDAVALVGIFLGGYSIFHAPHIWTLLAGPILAFPFAFLWIVSKGKWIGLGDAKLVLGIGWILGMHAGINSLVLAFWIASIASIIWMVWKYKKFKRGLEIPFGPYLILGMFIVLFWGVTVIDVRALLQLF